MADQQVPSPLHQALSELSGRIQKDQAAMANALKDACQRMGAGSTWVGYAADAWNSGLTGHSGDLASNVSAAVAEVVSALACTSPTCSPQQANMERRMLAGRLG